ncbi:uncharacterized protein [Cherax quadricarinatus]|uniref:uncharacterized protein n=1 Tax=Cherax quadricarinatus TaxID=27406 RepID=UPI00387E6240
MEDDSSLLIKEEPETPLVNQLENSISGCLDAGEVLFIQGIVATPQFPWPQLDCLPFPSYVDDAVEDDDEILDDAYEDEDEVPLILRPVPQYRYVFYLHVFI